MFYFFDVREVIITLQHNFKLLFKLNQNAVEHLTAIYSNFSRKERDVLPLILLTNDKDNMFIVM